MNRLVLYWYLATMVLLLKETVSTSLALLDLYSLDQTLQFAWGMESGNQTPGRWLAKEMIQCHVNSMENQRQLSANLKVHSCYKHYYVSNNYHSLKLPSTSE